MYQHLRSFTRLWVALAVAGGLVLGACGGDDDDPAAAEPVSDDGGSADESSGDGPEIAGSVGDDDLLVPRDYLQGVWCDSDGQTWTIDGDTARFGDGAGGVGELPVDILFLDGLDESLVSQTDDEFVVAFSGDEVTFTRGGC